MSRKATDWAWELRISAAQKILLLSFADRADDDDECFPSMARLEYDTCLDRKTILAWVKRFVELEILIDTGKRKGKTQQVKVYRINFDITPDKNFLKINQEDGKGSQISRERVPNFPAKGPKFPSKGSQKRDTEPTVEPTIESSVKHMVDSGESAVDVSKGKKAKPALQKEGKKQDGKTLPPIDRDEVVNAWNYTAETHGIPKIMAVSVSVEKGLLRLWRSYVHMCRSLKREPRDATEFICGYLGGAYKPTAWACGDNPTGKKYGIDTALRQERIDQILQELFSEVAQ